MHIQKPGVRVDVHRQVDPAVTHRCLRDAGSHTAFAQERAKRMPQRVDVDGSPSVIVFFDFSRGQITVLDFHQSLRHVEDSVN